jgi:paraquat-inducible protein B
MFVAYFPGSVKGLRIGAPVTFRGVTIGEVSQIRLYSLDEDMTVEIPVIFSIDPQNFHNLGPRPEPDEETDQEHMNKVIEMGLRAQMQLQSIVTGQRMINLDYFPNTPVRLLGEKGIDLGDDIVEIPTIKTIEQEIGRTLEDIPIGELAESLQNSMKGIERLVTSEEFSKSLHYFKQTMKEARNLVRHVDQKVDPLFADVDHTLKDAQTMLRDVNRQVDPLAGSIMQTSEDARKLVNNINKQVRPIQTDLANIAKSLLATLEEVDGLVSENSEFRYQIDTFLREIALAARSLRSFADYLERNPDALIRGKQRREDQK